jgi:hypothetical protein
VPYELIYYEGETQDMYTTSLARLRHALIFTTAIEMQIFIAKRQKINLIFVPMGVDGPIPEEVFRRGRHFNVFNEPFER